MSTGLDGWYDLIGMKTDQGSRTKDCESVMVMAGIMSSGWKSLMGGLLTSCCW